jgi:hypothetical protein
MQDAGMYRPLGDPGPGGGEAAPSFTNTAATDPRVSKHLDRLDKRLDDPMGSTGRAIDMAGSKIRDAMDGRRAAVKGMLAGRGVLGSSSVPELSEAAMSDAEGRQVNQAASDISLARERDNDQMLLGATGAYQGAASLNQGDRRLGLEQYLGEKNLAFNQQRGQLQDLLAVLGSVANF